jgi:ABC-type amino acid transport substrate-binding protein/exonuclease VII small subunit
MLEKVEGLDREISATDLDLDIMMQKVERGYELIRSMKRRLEETKTRIDQLHQRYDESEAGAWISMGVGMGRTFRNLLLITFYLCPGFNLLASEAANPLEMCTPPRVARVSYTKFPPWAYKNEKGQFVGILVDYIRDLAREAHLTLKEDEIPIARLHHSLARGKLDIFFAQTPEKDLPCCVSLGATHSSEIVIIGRKKGPDWDPHSKVRHSICRTGLSGYQVPGFHMFDADGPETCVRMVSRDRLPFLIGERYSALKIVHEQLRGAADLFADPVVVEKTPIHLYISKSLDRSSYGPALRKAARELKLNDYIMRYFPNSRGIGDSKR